MKYECGELWKNPLEVNESEIINKILLTIYDC